MILFHVEDKDSKQTKRTATIARQQLRKYGTVLESLLGIGPRAAMEV
jgi:hypothetical protein